MLRVAFHSTRNPRLVLPEPVVVTTVFMILFDVQFHLNVDWLFATGARTAWKPFAI
jgi:hypothetical protein